MCDIKSLRLGNVLKQPLNLQMLIKNTAISLGRTRLTAYLRVYVIIDINTIDIYIYIYIYNRYLVVTN